MSVASAQVDHCLRRMAFLSRRALPSCKAGRP
jgi:hypothetical protein